MYLAKNFLQRCNNSKEQQQIIFRRGKKNENSYIFHNSNKIRFTYAQ